MYPTWITNLFNGNTCPLCSGAVTLDDIIAIGARRPEPFEAHLREALALILVDCPHCHQIINFTTRCIRAGLIDALDEFCGRLERATAAPSPFAVQPVPEPSDDPIGITPVRPSIRANQQLQPPSQQEIQEFLRRLKNTSFRRKSKGFRRWMKGLGADAGDGADADES